MTGEPVSHLHLEFLEEFRRGKGLVSICPCIQLASIENIEERRSEAAKKRRMRGRSEGLEILDFSDSWLLGSCSLGAVAQLGERLICIQEVAGSIPTSSTSVGRSDR